jgi:hypothetical protein
LPVSYPGFYNPYHKQGRRIKREQVFFTLVFMGFSRGFSFEKRIKIRDIVIFLPHLLHLKPSGSPAHA